MEKRPEIQISVGAAYYAPNTPEAPLIYDPTKYGAVVKSPIIKKVGRKESSDSTVVKSSGIDYMTVSSKDSEELSVEAVAFAPDDLATFRGDHISEKGLISDDISPVKPFFGFGFPIEKTNGKWDYVWYPKCQLVESSGDVETKEDKFKEQNKTLTIKAYPFNDKNIMVHCDMETESFPEGLTEEKFFSKVIIDDATLQSVITTSSTPQGA